MSWIIGGGIMLPYSKQELSKKIFTYYLNNFNKIQLLSYGTYGIVLLLLLPNNIDTINEDNFYKQMTPNENYGKIVKSLIIKIQFINNNSLKVKLGNNEFVGISEKQIQDEINIQTDIFFKTFNYMQPLCPSIIYAEIIKDFSEKINILNLLRKADNLPFTVENNIIYNNDLGIIVMEMIYNSIPLFNYIDEKKEIIESNKEDIENFQKKIDDNINVEINWDKINMAMKIINQEKRKIEIVENISRYSLLKLALDTGYNHSDFHSGNILIQYDDTYFKNIDKSPILIDFGRTEKLPLNILNIIKQNVSQKNYIGALTELCKPFNSPLEHTKIINASYYQWVCGDYEGQLGRKNRLPVNVNTSIDELFELREMAIDENIQKMNKLHTDYPEKFPLLPLSNSIKNNLYNGMIGGKIKRKRKRKTKKNKFYRRNKSNKKHKTR
jgi:hypothetical protein